MPSLVGSLLAAAALAGAARGDSIRVVATTGNTFVPDTVTARPGDTVDFHFQGLNHSVVSGAYENPCSPMQLGSGFFSGFMPAQGGGEAGRVFRVAISSAEPTPFYSSQGDECSRGMVGIINPGGDRTLDGYRRQAHELSRSVTPGSAPYGGEMVENNDPNVQRNPDGTVRAAAPAAAPVVGAAAAAALAVAAMLW